MKKTLMITSFIAISLSACTSNVKVESPKPSATNNMATPTATANQTPSPTPSSTSTATQKPTVKPSSNTKSEVKSESTVNSNTNISINSNGTNVNITSKNGKRYAEVNGSEVELDSKGCYDYNQNGTKIHTCIN